MNIKSLVSLHLEASLESRTLHEVAKEDKLGSYPSSLVANLEKKVKKVREHVDRPVLRKLCSQWQMNKIIPLRCIHDKNMYESNNKETSVKFHRKCYSIRKNLINYVAERIRSLDSVFERLGKLRNFNIRVDASSKYPDSFVHTQDLQYGSVIIDLQHMRRNKLIWENWTKRPIKQHNIRLWAKLNNW